MGILYIVATPIGNLKDITIRAKEILEKVEFIACEDTRRTGLLIKQLGIEKKARFISFYEENEQIKMYEIIALLQKGNNVALVSDAGTPTISDPGFKLVRECIAIGIAVESIPGPSSVITALTVSGLPTDKFLFIGYLPKKPGKRLKLLEELKKTHQNTDQLKSTIILLESPHRLIKSLEELRVAYGNIYIVIARELTKMYEEVRREEIINSIAHFSKTPPKGEFVLLFIL